MKGVETDFVFKSSRLNLWCYGVLGCWRRVSKCQCVANRWYCAWGSRCVSITMRRRQHSKCLVGGATRLQLTYQGCRTTVVIPTVFWYTWEMSWFSENHSSVAAWSLAAAGFIVSTSSLCVFAAGAFRLGLSRLLQLKREWNELKSHIKELQLAEHGLDARLALRLTYPIHHPCIFLASSVMETYPLNTHTPT